MAQIHDPKEDLKKILPVLTAVLLMTAVVFAVLRSTVYSESYMQKKMEENGVYTELAQELRSRSARSYVKRSDADKRVSAVIDELTAEAMTEGPVRSEVDSILSQIYAGNTPEVRCEQMLAQYPDNIAGFLSSRGISMSRAKIDSLVQEMVDTARTQLHISSTVEKMPISVSGGTGRMVVFILLAAAGMAATLILSDNKLKAAGLSMLISGAMLLLAAVIINTAFDGDKFRLSIQSLTKLIGSVTSGIAAGSAISGVVIGLVGGAAFWYGKKKEY